MAIGNTLSLHADWMQVAAFFLVDLDVKLPFGQLLIVGLTTSHSIRLI